MLHRLAIAAMAVLSAVTLAQAQPPASSSWPDRPIKFIVHVAAGGGVDLMARVLADRLSQQMPQRVLIENMGGGGGAIAARTVAKADPDGYTFLFAGPGHAAVPYMHKQAPYDPIKDFIPVSLVTQFPLVVVINPNVPAKNLARVHRAAEEGAGQAHLRIERRRRLVAHPGRDADAHGGREDDPRAVSRQRPVVGRAARRPDRPDHRRARAPARQYRRAARAAPGGDDQGAHAVPAGCSRRVGDLAGIPVSDVGRGVRAGQDAEGDRRQTGCGNRQGRAGAGNQETLRSTSRSTRSARRPSNSTRSSASSSSSTKTSSRARTSSRSRALLTSQDRILTTHCGSLPRPPQLSETAAASGGRRTHRRAGPASRVRERRCRGAGRATQSRHRHRQRRRAAARRLLDVSAAAHGRLRRRVDPAVAARPRRFSAVHGAAAAEARTPQPHRQSAEGHRRGPLHRPAATRKAEYDLFQSALGRASSEARRDVHDRGLARHHRDHDGQRILRLLRDLRVRAGARAAQGIRADRLLRLSASARCAGLRARARAHVQGQDRRRIPARHGAQRRGDQPRHRRHSRANASGCTSAGATGKARTPTISRSRGCCRLLYRAKVGALSIEFANPRHQHEYAALRENPLPPDDDPDPRRDRHHHQFRRASGGGGQPHLRGGRKPSATAAG